MELCETAKQEPQYIEDADAENAEDEKLAQIDPIKKQTEAPSPASHATPQYLTSNAPNKVQDEPPRSRLKNKKVTYYERYHTLASFWAHAARATDLLITIFDSFPSSFWPLGVSNSW